MSLHGATANENGTQILSFFLVISQTLIKS
jgi:hypothetical protein